MNRIQQGADGPLAGLPLTSDVLAFRRYFDLARIPWITLGAVGLLCTVYFGWQASESRSVDHLLRLGAKSPVLMRELGQWWRLVTASLVHVSGWHLLVNVVFLLHLGAPTEAVLRRLDYLMVLVISAVGATLVSAVFNPLVSCGASGLVFGIWGAAAVFGIRHRLLLPARYRYYFIGLVVPYAAFALYAGVAIRGIDNWGHLGGLVAGSLVALRAPARIVVPRHSWATLKLGALAFLLALPAVASALPVRFGELALQPADPASELRVPVPKRWQASAAFRGEASETYVYTNGVGVAVSLQVERDAEPAEPVALAERLARVQAPLPLGAGTPLTVESGPAELVEVAGQGGLRVRSTLLTDDSSERVDTLVLTRVGHRYVVTLSAPEWLYPAYQPLFERVRAGVVLATHPGRATRE